MDLSHLSDEELEKLAAGDKQEPIQAQAPADLSHLSDEQLEAIANGDSFTEKLKDKAGEFLTDVVVPVGRTIDTYTGAPVRAAIGNAQDVSQWSLDNNPITAFAKQFGDAPEKAPTGKRLAQNMGLGETSVSDVLPSLYSDTGDEWLKFKRGGLLDPTASGAAGLGIDVAADWSNIVPVGAAAKLVGKGAAKGAGAAGKVAAKAAAKGVDLASGSKVGTKTAEAVGRGVDIAKSQLNQVVNPKQAEKWAEMLALAKRHGINPENLSEAVEFGPGSFISRASRNLAEGPAGEKLLLRHEKGIGEITGALDKEAVKIGAGSRMGVDEAGQALREGWFAGAKKFWDQADVMHSDIIKSVPGLSLSDDAAEKLASRLSGLEKEAKGMIARGAGDARAAGEELLFQIDQIKKGNGSYKQLYEQLAYLRPAAFSKPGANTMQRIPLDQRKMRDLYEALNDSLRGTVKDTFGAKAEKRLRDVNESARQFYSDKSLVARELGNPALADDKLFERLLSNPKKIEALKRVLPEQTIQNLKGALVRSWFKPNATSEISFKGLINNLRDNQSVVKALFSPKEIDEIEKLAKLGDSMGTPVLSTSGTGASIDFRNMLKTVSNAVVNDKVVEFMKQRARETGTPANKVLGGMKNASRRSQAGNVPVNQLVDMLKRTAGVRPSALSQAGKIAQVASVQHQNNPLGDLFKSKENSSRVPSAGELFGQNDAQPYIDEQQARDQFLKGN